MAVDAASHPSNSPLHHTPVHTMKLLPATLLVPALAASASFAAEVTVAKSPFFVTHTVGATAIPTETTLIRLPAEAWSDFEIAEIAAHGAKVAAGDILVEFNGKEIRNLYDFTYALQAEQPGNVVPVSVMRGDERIEVDVALEARR